MEPKVFGSVLGGAVGVLAIAIGVSVVVTKPGEVTPRESEYVMPDCGPDEKPVDCLFQHADTGEPVWLGCVSGPARTAVGTQCIAAPPSIILGSRLEKRSGQFVEVDKRGQVVTERREAVKDAGGVVRAP